MIDRRPRIAQKSNHASRAEQRRASPRAALWSSLALAFAFFVILWPSPVQAAVNYTLCLRIPVTIEDESGEPNEIGLSTPTPGVGGWVARGIHVADVKDASGVDHFGSGYANSSGCINVTIPGSPGTADYTVVIRTYGSLLDANGLEVRGVLNSYVSYAAVFEIPGVSGTYYLSWPDEEELLTTYTLLAYAINTGFRGRYDDEDLIVWWNLSSGASECTCGHECWKRISGNTRYICITENSDRRKFVLAHEYGHVNLDGAIDMSSKGSDCTYVGTGDAGDFSHAMRTVEYDSCAFHEGWGHFVAADIWHDNHGGGNPGAEFVLPNVDIDVNAGMSGCWSSVDHDNATNFPKQFGDDCRQDDTLCETGDCIGANTELDWMRALWDYHTDTSYYGSPPDHYALHNQIEAASGWNTNKDPWEQWSGSLSGAMYTRLTVVGASHGISY